MSGCAERWWQEVLVGQRRRPDRATADLEDGLPPLGELSDPFVVRLLQLLRDQGAAAARGHGPARSRAGSHAAWTRTRSSAASTHRQAANQVTVGNCVLSLRLLSAVDWNTFFERSSLVEEILRDDPAGVYPLQDFATSDRYRKAVEKIARGSDADEIDVARKAIELARAGSSQGRAKGHVGYYLLDRGEAELRAAFGYRPGRRRAAPRRGPRAPEAVYFGSICLLLGLLLLAGFAAWRSASRSRSRWYWHAADSARRVLPLSELAVGLVNHLLTLLLPPRVLPKLEFKEGIPEEFATFVVMPSMLVRPEQRRGPLRTAGDPLPGQPHAGPPLRPAHRLRRRPAGEDARRRRSAHRRRPAPRAGS